MSDARTQEDFDPSHVPVFPVLTVELTADGGARLNGRPLPVEPGQNPSDVAIQAAADEARLMPGDRGAVRVRGVDPHGHVFPLVVRADGAVFELPTAPAIQGRSRPPWLVPAITGAVALALGGAAIGAAVAARDDAAPAPVVTAPAPLPGAGANLPVPAPPGYSQRATWAVPISEQVVPVATASGDLLAADGDGDLVLLDDLTGRVLWSGQDAPASGALHLVDDQGVELAATSTAGALTLWSLPEPAAGDPAPTAAPRATAPLVVALPRGASASFDGSAPLVTLEDQTAAIVTQGALDLVDVPVGASAVAADADSVTAVSITGTLYDLVPGAEPVARELARPPGTDPRPVRSIGAGAQHVIVVWATSDRQWVALHDATTGAIRSYGATSADLTRATVVRQQGAGRLTIGPVLVTFGQPDGAAVVPLDPDLRPEAVTTGHVYGDLDREPVDARTTATGVAVQQIPVDDLATPGSPTPCPVATSPTHAYVTASKVEQYLLHAVPSTAGTP